MTPNRPPALKDLLHAARRASARSPAAPDVSPPLSPREALAAYDAARRSAASSPILQLEYLCRFACPAAVAVFGIVFLSLREAPPKHPGHRQAAVEALAGLIAPPPDAGDALLSIF